MKQNFFLILSAFVFTGIVGCTKNDPPPFKISIDKITDSLTLNPITFHATVSEPPESYSWNFGDGSTSTLLQPQHAYQNMGIFNVVCTATLRGASYNANYKLEIKGDSRLVGQQRNFYGTEYYNTAVTGLGTPINFVTRTITDTVLIFTAPSHFQLAVFNNAPAAWQHVTLGEVLYQYNNVMQVGSVRALLYYYPAKDSCYVYYNANDNPHYGDLVEYKLYQKK